MKSTLSTHGGFDAEAETPGFWSSDVNNWLIGKVPVAGKVLLQAESIRGWVSLDGITNAMDMNLSKLSETVRDREAWYASFHMVAKSQTWLGDWTSVFLTDKNFLLTKQWNHSGRLSSWSMWICYSHTGTAEVLLVYILGANEWMEAISSNELKKKKHFNSPLQSILILSFFLLYII